jgi:hypothetical protein
MTREPPARAETVPNIINTARSKAANFFIQIVLLKIMWFLCPFSWALLIGLYL